MPKKRLVFFHRVQPILKSSSSGRWVTQFLLALSTAFLCTVVSPVLAKSPVVNSAVPSLPDNPAGAYSLVQQGKTLYEAGQFAEAAAVWQQAAEAFKTQRDVLNQAMVLSNLSLAFEQLGHWPQATQTIADSLQLLQTRQDIGPSKDRLQVLGQALNTQGHLQLALGQAEQALATWQQVTATYTEAGYNAGITGSLINQAQALQSLGVYRRANKILTQLEQTLQNQPDSLLKATGLRSLGNALQVVGDLDQSRRVLQQSLTLATKLKSPQEIAAAWVSLGNTAIAQQDNSAALKFYQQAESASTSPTTRVQAQLNQLSLLLETESWLPAQALWLQIQPEIANLPPSRTAVYARINFAQSLMKLGAGEQGSRGASR